MTNIWADRVQETTATTGAGTITLAGASTQFQSFAAAVGNGNTCDYCILSGNGTDWETGNGTVSTSGGNTLARTTVYASSNSGAAISLSGTSTVFLTLSAHSIGNFGSGGGSGLFNQAMSATPTQTSTGLSTWENQGSATVTNAATGLTIYQPNVGGTDDWCGLHKAAPSTPYSFTALLAQTSNRSNYPLVGLGWSNGSGGVEAITLYSNSDAMAAAVLYYSGYSTYSSAPYGPYAIIGNPCWFKIRDDGTTVYFMWSADGVNFITLYSVAKSSGALGSGGYSNVFFGVSARNSDTYGTLMSWAQGT